MKTIKRVILWLKWLVQQPSVWYYRYQWRKLQSKGVVRLPRVIDQTGRDVWGEPAYKPGERVSFNGLSCTVTGFEHQDAISSVEYRLREETTGTEYLVLGHEDLKKA